MDKEYGCIQFMGLQRVRHSWEITTRKDHSLYQHLMFSILKNSSVHRFYSVGESTILRWEMDSFLLWEGIRVPEKIYFCFIDYAKAFDCVGHNKLWKILKEMGIPDHLTDLLRNLYAGQEATVRTGHGTTDWFPIGKGASQGCILSPCLFNLYTEYIMRNAGLEEAQAGIKTTGRNISNLRWHHPYGRKWRRTKEPLDERGEWKSWLNIQKTKIMASGPIISWQIDGETVETVSDFIFLGSKITADGDCTMKLKDICSLE